LPKRKSNPDFSSGPAKARLSLKKKKTRREGGFFDALARRRNGSRSAEYHFLRAIRLQPF
jgi:hypothetical protein